VPAPGPEFRQGCCTPGSVGDGGPLGGVLLKDEDADEGGEVVEDLHGETHGETGERGDEPGVKEGVRDRGEEDGPSCGRTECVG
jgi:hypothetical protein